MKKLYVVREARQKRFVWCLKQTHILCSCHNKKEALRLAEALARIEGLELVVKEDNFDKEAYKAMKERR
jgi:hypothetical protein